MRSKFICLFFVIALVMGVSRPASSANLWRNGDGSETPGGNTEFNDIDEVIDQRIVQPAERLLAKFRHDAKVSYSSASQLTVNSGSIACQNSAGSITRFRQNTSSTTVTWSDLDTGSESSSTTYYVYGVCDADATTFTITISESSTTPTGITYFKLLGTFINDSSSNITEVDNYFPIEDLGQRVSKSTNTTYQAATDGFVTCYHSASNTTAVGYNDWSSSPTTIVIRTNSVDGEFGAISFPVQEGSYYKCTETGGASDGVMFFVPLN